MAFYNYFAFVQIDICFVKFLYCLLMNFEEHNIKKLFLGEAFLLSGSLLQDIRIEAFYFFSRGVKTDLYMLVNSR